MVLLGKLRAVLLQNVLSGAESTFERRGRSPLQFISARHRHWIRTHVFELLCFSHFAGLHLFMYPQKESQVSRGVRDCLNRMSSLLKAFRQKFG